VFGGRRSIRILSSLAPSVCYCLAGAISFFFFPLLTSGQKNYKLTYFFFYFIMAYIEHEVCERKKNEGDKETKE